jgi:hypothetical protein
LNESKIGELIWNPGKDDCREVMFISLARNLNIFQVAGVLNILF